MIRKAIPNFFTLCNMASGSIAVILAVQNHLVMAAIFVGIGIFFDFFDGFFARLLKVTSSLGLQLDSLADMITSGLVPGIVMVQLLIRSLQGETGAQMIRWERTAGMQFDFPILALMGLLITLGSGYRLAKFNIDTRQTSSFIGLPTPANAILILSLPLILMYQDSPHVTSVLLNKWFLIGLTLFSTMMLNVELPLFGLKFQSFKFSDNWFRYSFLLFSLIALVILKFLALPVIILIYILFNIALYYLSEE